MQFLKKERLDRFKFKEIENYNISIKNRSICQIRLEPIGTYLLLDRCAMPGKSPVHNEIKANLKSHVNFLTFQSLSVQCYSGPSEGLKIWGCHQSLEILLQYLVKLQAYISSMANFQMPHMTIRALFRSTNLQTPEFTVNSHHNSLKKVVLFGCINHGSAQMSIEGAPVQVPVPLLAFELAAKLQMTGVQTFEKSVTYCSCKMCSEIGWVQTKIPTFFTSYRF